ncbi:hypothetical protein EIK77_006158 [Talaromyces pinophilus]|nr:hypothetical protein EIK77_006158 [Talaromyces pinophilus]PCG88852.1 Hypothetical protein PENO1_107910 [Penicillium occitanis (nom. inval.)]PCG89015.1 hypothetical protein PENOC_108440 [Penicillium occitanis (nom. inval.)]
MQNYVHGEIVSPTGKFEALQSVDGHSLLFSIDSSGILNVFEEQSGSSYTGWQVHDLSTATIRSQFAGREDDAVVRIFDVGQSAKDATIGLTMVVELAGEDHLFVSLGNANKDTSWTGRPAWTPVPFDAVNENSQKIVITGTLIAEMLFGRQYLIADIQRLSGGSVDPHITRYHIDICKETGTYWVKHDVTVDIATEKHQSYVGQVSKGHVDGIYTAVTTGGQPQLVYEPIVNYYGDGPPAPRRLHLPGNEIPSAIATSRKRDLTTGLYAISGSTLYRFPADKQSGDKDEPLVVVTNDLLNGTDALHSMTHAGVTTIWGRNSKYQVYYLACPASQVGQTDAWSVAVPILSGIERISPYLNRTDGGNTIFAAGNGKLQKLIQGSAESGKNGEFRRSL